MKSRLLTKYIFLFSLLLSNVCQAQNAFPSTGTTILNSGSDQALIIKDSRSATNWNYIEWQFSTGTRDWVIGRHQTSGYFTWYREGIAEVMTLDNSGRLGIGTTTPGQKLEVNGNIHLNAENAGLGVDAYGSTPRLGFLKQFGNYPVIASDTGTPIIFSQTNQVGILTNISTATVTERMRINNDGNVGIGTQSPDAKLTVNGQIHATEVKVTTTVPIPDYVFEKSYELTSLDEVKICIDQNKHLPEVPSATEIEKNGLNLGEMNLLLLKKIEELTLHAIQQEERIKILESKINH